MSKWIGYALVTIGFIGATLVAVLDVHHTQWSHYSLGLVAGIVGVVLLRWHAHQLKSCQHVQADNMKSLTDSMEFIVKHLESLVGPDLNSEQCIAMHQIIDHDFVNPLRDFADARESISHIYGLQTYADVMSSFATGERYLNRVWSASADGYIDEVAAFLPKAQQQFTECREKLRALN